MTTPLILSGTALDAVLIALRTSLETVEPEQLGAPTLQQEWRNVIDWIDKAERRENVSVIDGGLVRLEDFPLSGANLHALRTTVARVSKHNKKHSQPMADDIIEALHAKEAARVPKTGRMKLHQGINRVNSLSWGVATFLGLSLAFNGIAWIFVRTIPLTWLIGVNLTIVVLASAVWLLLHGQVVSHRFLLQRHLPSQIPTIYVQDDTMPGLNL